MLFRGRGNPSHPSLVRNLYFGQLTRVNNDDFGILYPLVLQHSAVHRSANLPSKHLLERVPDLNCCAGHLLILFGERDLLMLLVVMILIVMKSHQLPSTFL